MLLHQYVVAIQTNPFSIHYLYQRKRNIFSCFPDLRIVGTWRVRVPVLANLLNECEFHLVIEVDLFENLAVLW